MVSRISSINSREYTITYGMTVMAIHFVLPRPSEIQEVLSQVKVRKGAFTKEGQIFVVMATMNM